MRGRKRAMPASGAENLANVHVELKDAIAIVHLARPAKRNALNDEIVFSLERWFSRPPEQQGRRACRRCGPFLRRPRSL
jgi:hypothetical protein